MNANDLNLLDNYYPKPPEGCSAVGDIIRNNERKPVAVECVCGKIHPILGGNILRWGDVISKEVLFSMVEENVSYIRILARYSVF